MSPRRPARGGAVATLACALAAGLAAILVGPVGAAARQVPSRPRAPVRPPALSARAAILVEPDQGIVAYRRHADRELAVASTTKLMTVLLALERAPLDERLAAVPYRARPVESAIDLRPGERMSVGDLVRAALIASANDAAATLAGRLAPSRAAFVTAMNRRAAALGLRHTHYTTPIGLDVPSNHSSAADLVRLVEVLRRNPFFDRTVDRSRAVLQTGDHRRIIRSTNTLLGRVPWVDGVKTGHTLDAGYVLIGSGRRRGLRFISVVLGDPSEAARDRDTRALLAYGFARYRLARPLVGDRPVARRPVAERTSTRVALAPTRSVTHVVARGRPVSLSVHAPRRIDGPLPVGAVVGSVDVDVGRQRVARVPLAVRAPVPAVDGLQRAGAAIDRPLPIALLAAAAGLLALAVARRAAVRRRRGARERARSETPA